jgi:hypothetical protein
MGRVAKVTVSSTASAATAALVMASPLTRAVTAITISVMLIAYTVLVVDLAWRSSHAKLDWEREAARRTLRLLLTWGRTSAK